MMWPLRAGFKRNSGQVSFLWGVSLASHPPPVRKSDRKAVQIVLQTFPDRRGPVEY
ncbi:hypothetical protein [Hyphomonas sp.]|uniref:hypothetical protein n=1 Tax=Hyphomonas sp. TaxID=87 RepID=UPI00329A2715